MDMQIQQMSEEERDKIIRYGIKRGKVIFFSTLITVLIGGLLGVVWQSIIFWSCLSILRKYAGGYHADTEQKCYVISLIIVIISLLCIKLIGYNMEWGIALQTMNLLIIYCLAPVENKNHILDIDEKRIYRIRTRITAMSLYLVYMFSCCIDAQRTMVSVGMAYLVVTLSLVLGNVTNYRDGIY